MTYTDKHIVETYAQLLEGLSNSSKTELVDTLNRSLKKAPESKDKIFYSSFGAFGSAKEAEEIVSDLKQARKFRQKDISF